MPGSPKTKEMIAPVYVAVNEYGTYETGTTRGEAIERLKEHCSGSKIKCRRINVPVIVDYEDEPEIDDTEDGETSNWFRALLAA